MLLESLLDRGSLPVLQRVMAFTEARHEVLANNVSNFDTVGYKTKDLSVEEFNDSLRRAVERRNRRGLGAPLAMNATRHLRWDAHGRLQAKSEEIRDNNILFHDRNNRFVEKQFSNMAKNTMTHNLATEMLRQQYNLLQMAISERV